MGLIVRLLSLAALLGVFVPLGISREVDTWEYDRLFKEADLVVIAEATSVSDTPDHPTDEFLRKHVLGQDTKFKVEYALKGKASGNQITVLHYQLKNGITGILNGPMLVTFRTKPVEVKVKGEDARKIQPSYLLFLKLRKDGRYEPVSGETDPRDSVREINFPPSR